jgi:hypothetical protein
MIPSALSRGALTPTEGGSPMADDRLIRRLEEQLRDAHATNADLRGRLEEKRKIEAQAAYDVSKVGPTRKSGRTLQRQAEGCRAERLRL